MSWLKTIYESIINEISAEDAYNRFYSSIPREDYDKILDGDPAPDKFVQFILNCVRDGKNDANEAAGAIKLFKSADALVKQNILNKFRAGEYDDVFDIISDIRYFSEGGGIVSRKKFAKEGYIKIKENERWVATCTTNYMANNHYFGNSHWCTASDRMGRYDGYRMFVNYTLDHGSSILIQFMWKGKVKKENEDEPESLDDIPDNAFHGDDGYVYPEIPEEYRGFQVQLSRRLSIGQICNFFDESMYDEDLKRWIGTEMYDVLSDEDVYNWLWKRTDEQAGKEKVYQKKIDITIEKKKERRWRQQEERKRNLQAECDEANAAQKERAIALWNEFVSNKEYENPEIVKILADRDINSEYHERTLDERIANLEKTKYACIVNLQVSENDIAIAKVNPILGKRKYVDYNDNDEYEIFVDESSDRVADDNIVIILNDSDTDNPTLIKAFKFDSPTLDIREISKYGQRWGAYERRFYKIAAYNSVYCEDETCDGGIFYDSELNKYIGFDGEHNYYSYMDISEDKYLFFTGDKVCGNKYFMYNPKTGEMKPWTKGDPLVSVWGWGDGFSLYQNDSNVQSIYPTNYPNLKGMVIPTRKPIASVGIFPGNKYLLIVHQDETQNAFHLGDSEMLFGIDGGRVDGWDGEHFISVVRVNRESFILGYNETPDDKGITGYWRTSRNRDEKIPCDKYGETKKEKIAKRNFADWQKNGGHSPEAKAQMEKMWADRMGDDYDYSGKKAMDAWNDDDLGRDKYGIQKSMLSVLPDELKPHFPDDGKEYDRFGIVDRGGGKNSDPNNVWDATPHFYRIARNGQPIDQPWNSEDEIPANLSDRVVREQKIHESFNKMKSIWDRMGLNE